jgi:hypothetical protein
MVVAARPSAVPSASRQLRALLRKNLALIKRSPRSLGREIGIPIVLLAILVGIRSTVHNTSFSDSLSAPTHPLEPLYASTSSALYLAPCGEPGSPVSTLSELLNASSVATRCFETEAAMMTHVVATSGDSCLAAVVFDNTTGFSPSPVLPQGMHFRFPLASCVFLFHFLGRGSFSCDDASLTTRPRMSP